MQRRPAHTGDRDQTLPMPIPARSRPTCRHRIALDDPPHTCATVATAAAGTEPCFICSIVGRATRDDHLVRLSATTCAIAFLRQVADARSGTRSSRRSSTAPMCVDARSLPTEYVELQRRGSSRRSRRRRRDGGADANALVLFARALERTRVLAGRLTCESRAATTPRTCIGMSRRFPPGRPVRWTQQYCGAHARARLSSTIPDADLAARRATASRAVAARLDRAT